jgi:hypothetical protein
VLAVLYGVFEHARKRHGLVRTRSLARFLAARGNPDADELIFPGTGGSYLDASALRRRADAGEAAGLQPPIPPARRLMLKFTRSRRACRALRAE